MGIPQWREAPTGIATVPKNVELFAANLFAHDRFLEGYSGRLRRSFFVVGWVELPWRGVFPDVSEAPAGRRQNRGAGIGLAFGIDHRR